jgi:hypothetical protein
MAPFLLEVISKKSFGPISVLGPRFNSSEYLKYACGLNLGPALILNKNPIFEMASITYFKKKLSAHCCVVLRLKMLTYYKIIV